MKTTLPIRYKWWVGGVLAFLGLCFAFYPPTTLWAHPPRQDTELPASCQISEVTFSQSQYQLNEQIKVKVRLADAGGSPLAGAHVTARVEKSTSLASQATNGVNLVDQTGTYVGAYNTTDVEGLYQFFITASDPTGQRFSLCAAEASVAVGDDPVPGPVDLVISRLGIEQERPASCQENNNPLGVRVEVRNNGTAAAGSFVISVNGNQQTVNGLAPNASTSVFFGGLVPSGEPTIATVDAANQVAESNEDNNTLEQFLPIPTPLPPCTPTPTGTPETPTATPTATATPTNTPTATPTTQPGQTAVGPRPQNLTLCGSAQSMVIAVEDVTDLIGFELVITYDPDVVQVVDANAGQPGVQVAVGSAFAGGFVGQNQVDTAAGRISLATILLGGDNLDGDVDLMTINWQPQSAGTSPVTLANASLVDLDAREIPTQETNGSIQVNDNCGEAISGQVSLQGRSNYSQIIVKDTSGQQTQTDAQGSFTLAGAASLTASYPGYLSAQASAEQISQASSDGVEALNLGSIQLLAGDVNADNLIDILDLAYMGTRLHTTDSLGDLNADGTVNILDLAMAAGNYRQSGPLTNWR